MNKPNLIHTEYKNLCMLFLSIFNFFLLSCADSSKHPNPDPVIIATNTFVKGADVSWITEMEASERKFYNAFGVEMEAMTLLKDLGFNTVRLRVWVNPSPPWCNTADVLSKALRAKSIGLQVAVNFHYSDSWADPGKQYKPSAWSNQNFTELKAAVSTHTADVLTKLKNEKIDVRWIQIGNEINDGMLWPDGKASVPNGFSKLAQLINSGYDVAKGIFPNAKIIIHISNGWDNDLFRWFFDGLKNNNAKWDIIGMSFYPNLLKDGTNNWQSYTNKLLTNMSDMVSRYSKEVMIVEIGMPWDNAELAKNVLTDVISKTKSVSNSKGLGVMYWEPQAYNGWKNYSLGAFDNSGKPTIALDAFK